MGEARTPTHGYTALGHAVHARTLDHLPRATALQRFNASIAVVVTRIVGSMWCAYAFAALALVSAPAALATHDAVVIVAWISQTLLQLTLLSVIMVGQDVQAKASDARAAKTFEDTEAALASLGKVLDALDLDTVGGLTEVLDAIQALRSPTPPGGSS